MLLNFTRYSRKKPHHVVSFKHMLDLLGEPHEANECREDKIWSIAWY